MGCRPHPNYPVGLSSPNGASQLPFPTGEHCSGLLLYPPESSWGPVSPAGSARSQHRSPSLLPPQQSQHHMAKTIIWIIFMGLKPGWEQMGCELGIWGWVSTSPTSQSFKKPSSAQGRARSQQRSGQAQGAGTRMDQEEKVDGSLAPYIKVSRPQP